jgi:hypothetical protein
MHRASLHRLVPALSSSARRGGCGDDSGTTTDGDRRPVRGRPQAKGQLVITEIMADPAGADDDSFEWFELYNPGPDEVSLAGVGLEYSKVDGTDGKGHRIPDSGLTHRPPAPT